MNDYSVIVDAKYNAIVHAENEEDAVNKFYKIIMLTIKNQENYIFFGCADIKIDDHIFSDSTGIANTERVQHAKKIGYYVE
jgi:hypothetical protein